MMMTSYIDCKVLSYILTYVFFFYLNLNFSYTKEYGVLSLLHIAKLA